MLPAPSAGKHLNGWCQTRKTVTLGKRAGKRDCGSTSDWLGNDACVDLGTNHGLANVNQSNRGYYFSDYKKIE